MTSLEDQLNQMRSERDAYKLDRDWFRETLIERTQQLRAAEAQLEAVKALHEEWGNRPPFEPNRKLWTALGRILSAAPDSPRRFRETEARLEAVRALCDQREQYLIERGAAKSTAELTNTLTTADVRAALGGAQ